MRRVLVEARQLRWEKIRSRKRGHSEDQAFFRTGRLGVIVRTGTLADMAPVEAMCSLADQSSTARFAYVQFIFGPTHGKFLYSGPHQRHVIVPLPQGGGLHEGARVYINLQDCNQAAVPASATTP